MKILKSAGMVSFFTMISRITGFIRDVIIAEIVGTGTFADVFFAAFKLTNILRKVLIEGSFFAAFVPSFTKIKEHYGIEQAKDFASKMLSIALYTVAVITVLANIFMPQLTAIMAPGFSGEKLSMTISLSYIIFWYFVAIALISIISGALNGLHKFSYYSIVPVFLNLSIIFFIFFLRDNFKNIAYCLAWSVVAGGIVQFIFIYLACVYENFVIRVKLPRKTLFDEHTIASYKKMIPSIIGGGATQFNTMVDLILGSYIVSGVSHLYYADRIFFLPTSMIGTAISIVILPFISKQISKHNFEKANRYIKEAIQLASVLVFPASFFLILNSEVLISIIFERGAFNTNDARVVSKILQILGVALPFCVLTKIMSSIFFSYSDTKTPMYITFFSVIVNVCLSLALMPYLGIYAISMGTTISYILSFIVSATILIYRKMLKIEIDLMIFITKILIVSFVSLWILQYMALHPTFGYYAMFFSAGIMQKLLYIFTLLSFSGVVYVACCFMLGINFRSIFFTKHKSLVAESNI